MNCLFLRHYSCRYNPLITVIYRLLPFFTNGNIALFILFFAVYGFKCGFVGY